MTVQPRRVDPLLFVLAGVAAGVVVAALHEPRTGLFLVAAALGAGALLRLVLRPRDAGSLVVRSRRIDVAVLGALAAALALVTAFTHLAATGRG